MMNSFYWTQSLLVIIVAILAFFISFGPSQNRAKWLTAIGITSSVALFVANQVVMSNTGDGLDKQLNCWIWPSGVACPKPAAASVPIMLPDRAKTPKLTAQDLYDQGGTAFQVKDFTKARVLYENACVGGVAQGCTNLGLMWQKGEGGESNVERARALYERACDGEDAAGCYNLGVMYQNGGGLGPSADIERSRALYKQECEAGDADACAGLKLLEMLPLTPPPPSKGKG